MDQREAANRRRLDAHVEIAGIIPQEFADLHVSYLGGSSLFLSKDALDLAWLWIMDWRNNISGASYAWSVRDRPHRMHRILLVRDPGDIKNGFLRERWQYTIRTFCHLHLWDGAVLYVIFVPEAISSFDVLANKFNFSYFTSKHLFPLDDFWSTEYAFKGMISGTAAVQDLRERLSLISGDLIRGALMLWYDPATFEPRRRPNDSLYRSQRRFTFKVFNGVCQSPRGSAQCLRLVDLQGGHADHIMPVGIASNILLNLTWLCTPCNLIKGATDTVALPLERAGATVPKRWATAEIMEAISLAAPAWNRFYRERPKSLLTSGLFRS